MVARRSAGLASIACAQSREHRYPAPRPVHMLHFVCLGTAAGGLVHLPLGEDCVSAGTCWDAPKGRTEPTPMKVAKRTANILRFLEPPGMVLGLDQSRTSKAKEREGGRQGAVGGSGEKRLVARRSTHGGWVDDGGVRPSVLGRLSSPPPRLRRPDRQLTGRRRSQSARSGRHAPSARQQA